MKPASVEEVRKMARIRAIDAAPLWGLNPRHISRYCCRGEIPGAVLLHKAWYVTADGMDKMFTKKQR